MVSKIQREKGTVLVALPAIFTGINMFDGLRIKAASSWLGYKRSKAMMHAMEAIYKDEKLFHDKFVLGNTMVVLAKVTFTDLQALKAQINGHDEHLDLLDKNFSSF